MGVITKEEIKGNPPRTETDTTPTAPVLSKEDQAAEDKRVAEAARRRQLAISGPEAREVGESALTRGALERAEAKVGNTGPMPVTKPREITRITVNRAGEVIDDSQATEGATVLTGAEADAYLARHPRKEAEKSADKTRKTKQRTKTRKISSKARRR